jgi:hypothetical protein
MALQPSLIKVHPIPTFQSCPIVTLVHVQVAMCIMYQLTSSRYTLCWLLSYKAFSRTHPTATHYQE